MLVGILSKPNIIVLPLIVLVLAVAAKRTKDLAKIVLPLSGVTSLPFIFYFYLDTVITNKQIIWMDG